MVIELLLFKWKSNRRLPAFNEKSLPRRKGSAMEMDNKSFGTNSSDILGLAFYGLASAANDIIKHLTCLFEYLFIRIIIWIKNYSLCIRYQWWSQTNSTLWQTYDLIFMHSLPHLWMPTCICLKYKRSMTQPRPW